MTEYPKWVVPHASHVVRSSAPDHPERPEFVSVLDFPVMHIDRDGRLAVLVQNADEEHKATYPSDKAEGPVSEPAPPDPT